MDASSSGNAQARVRVDLGGEWERWIGDGLLDCVQVPSSYRPVGTARLRRSFDLDALGPGRRAVLRFEGIAYDARVRVNGEDVGAMGPWTRYEFDVTRALRPGRNRIEVEVNDWQVPLGPSAGWEAYGGIIRDVFLELRPDPYIENAHLQYELSADMDRADCALDVYLKSTAGTRATLRAELLWGTAVVSRAAQEFTIEAGDSQVTLDWQLKSPVLWSPEGPNLYTMRVNLESAHGKDDYAIQTGFRDLRIDGRRFVLNGRTLVLRGVGRHDMWKDQGHTLSDTQVEQDMRMAKTMGANFVRLVHYPHDRRIVEAADRLGLFVTEESGLMWMKFAKLDREVIEIGLQNLERTVRRDWNSPSLFAILLGNESEPTVEVILEGKRRMRDLTPGLFVSFAQCEKRFFDEGGLGFYTVHPYGLDYEMSLYRDRAVALEGGKPLVFTEWGGRVLGQSPILMKASVEEIGRLVEEGRLAGHSYWGWADMPEFSRGGLEPEDGILRSGVVTEDRGTIRDDVRGALVELFRYEPRAPVRPARAPEILTPRTRPLSSESRFLPIDLQPLLDVQEQSDVWAELESLMARFWKTHGMTVKHWDETGRTFWLWSCPEVSVGALPFTTGVHDGQTRPVVVTPGHRKVEVPLGIEADRLHVLGNVTLPDGYPVTDRLGERAASYEIVYADGERQHVPLRWGTEIARANMIAVASRIDPAAAQGERVVVYVKHPFREVYQTRLLSLDVKPKQIDRLVCELETPMPGNYAAAESASTDGDAELPPLGPGERALLLFAITAETGESA